MRTQGPGMAGDGWGWVVLALCPVGTWCWPSAWLQTYSVIESDAAAGGTAGTSPHPTLAVLAAVAM